MLFRSADLALYAAKGSERGGLVEYPTGDTEGAVRLRTRLAWGRRLHRALEDDAFVLYADPVVDLRTGAVDGVELLLHLHDGDEFVPRDGYLAHALRNGLAERLDRWLVAHAIAAAPALGDAFVAPVGVAEPEWRVGADWDGAIGIETRRTLALALSATYNAPIPTPRFGVFRM